MAEGNPFRPDPAPQQVGLDAHPGNLCVLMGTLPMMKVPRNRILGQDQMPEVQHVLTPCISERCAFWSAELGACHFVAAARAQIESAATLERVAVALQPLAKMFGGRS